MKLKSYKLLFCIFLIVFQSSVIYAQNNVETKTININNHGLFQIDFTSPINNQLFTSPANATEYYVLKPLKDNRSITLQTDKTSLPPTTLRVEETNGKTWNINILYKADIDLENESVFDFADNSAARGRNNIILRKTEEKNTLTKQSGPIPYSAAELGQLNKTYPAIDFSAPPPTQTFNRIEEGKSDLAFNEELYNTRPDLKLAFKSEIVDISIVCQNLVFNTNNAYLKLLFQNNSAVDFLTGNMLLTLIRQDGSAITLHPSYIFPDKFPILKSKHQISLIYAFKAYNVTADDNLKFEISDRPQKINLEFTIAGSVYNEARKD